MSETGKERESRQKDELEGKSLEEILKEILTYPFRKLKELVERLKRLEKRTTDQEQILAQAETERGKRRNEYINAHPKFKKEKERIKKAVEDIFGQVGREPEEQQGPKYTEARLKAQAQREKIRQLAQAEEEKIKKPKYQGVAEDEVEKVLEHLGREEKRAEPKKTSEEKEVRRQMLESGGWGREDPEADREMLEIIARIRANPEDKALLKDFEKLLRQMPTIYDLFRKEGVDGIKCSRVVRERCFQELVDRFGNDPNRHFREGDMQAIGGLAQFMQAVLHTEIEGEYGPDMIQKYSLRFGFEENVHNLDRFLKGHAQIDKLPELLTGFDSRMMDVTLREPGVAAAFRAYEQAFDHLMMFDKKINPAKVGFNPDDETIWINQWVRKQVKKTLEDYCQEHSLNYNLEFEPYEKTIIRTGWKVFIFTLRGDEIQASYPYARVGPEAPWHEDLWRRLDPLGMPIKYWRDRLPGVDAFLGEKDKLSGKLSEKDKKMATAIYYLFGEDKDIKKEFRTIKEYQQTMEDLEEKGGIQLNIFNAGGVLSKSPWRAKDALRYITKIGEEESGGKPYIGQKLVPFLGIEMHNKFASENLESKRENLEPKREVFSFALKRNPFALFRLASREAQDEILRRAGDLTPEDLKKEGGVYDLLAQALQQLVYEQEQGLKRVIGQKTEDAKIAEAVAFVEREKDKTLLDFVDDAKAKDLVIKIQDYFKPEGENFEKLVTQREPFSLGTEDAPMALMRFLETGDIGLQRRFRDVAAAGEATGALWEIIRGLPIILQKDEAIVESLAKLRKPLDDYGPGNIEGIMMTIASKMLGLLEEDNKQNLLPWPLDKVREKYWPICKADRLYGMYHSSKGAEDMRLLIEKMIGAGLFSGMNPKEVRKTLYKKHGLQLWKIFALDRAWRYGPLVVIGIPLSALIIIIKQAYKDLEEEAKEA